MKTLEYTKLFIFLPLLLLLVVFLVALFLRQPKIANGTIRLISQNQPYELLSPQNGKLILLHKLDEHINKMSEIAYIHNSVEYGIVQMLQNTIYLTITIVFICYLPILQLYQK